jgi:hypothetical protein
MNQRIEPRARHLAARGILLVVLAAIAYLALVPNREGQFLPFLPQKIRRWICEHDDFNNVVAFAILGLVAFRIGRKGNASPDAGILRRVFARREARLASLMALVCLLELAQLVIPGRMSGLRDVCTGWSGLFAAWLLASVFRWHSPGK